MERLAAMIRDKKIEGESRKTVGLPSEKDPHYEKLAREIDSVKGMILDLRANQGES